ncbi:Gfo/Idh/MocA family oxidoreductase [Crossiella sp. CA-258035]|uniref:Gfo/Idh/MocA family protein n=1 Tax=Crossiella sp. CA-258035 TaxID=2981138 RepID=UPI0024BC2E01|nr:Gfo/Idh/MocA family oxidoreductase [Crossiella sp. CA-258035]WHT23339.1 Gfo/Idh/MocA family oxidoreductase [Crossiella sp. CA-258035]
MSQTPLRIGVMGCADIAWRRTLPAMAAVPQVALVAVGSRDRERAALFAGRFGGDPVVGYERILERADVDAVYVPLPIGLHGEWVARALAAGKHVLVEKPLTTGRDAAEELVLAARRRGLVLMENFAFLHHSQHAFVRRLIAEGAIGDLRSVTSEFGVPPRAPEDFRYREDLGGGALLDMGVYPLRAAMMFLGPDLEVRGASLRFDPAYRVEVSGSVLLTSPQDVTAHLTFGFERSYRCRYAVWGSAGRLSVDRAFTSPDWLRPVVRIQRQDRLEELTLPAEDQFAESLRAFAAAVGDEAGPGGDGDLMTTLAGLVESVRAAARTATPVP